MTAALVTLAFLTTLWMLVVVVAILWDHSGAKILAAVKGRSLAPSLITRPVRLRHQRFQMPRAYRAISRQRAAA
jgi:hypothetical protein